MERPQSIRIFELCYLGALAVGLVNTLMHWSLTSAMPQVQQANAMIGTWYMPAVSAIGFIVPLILWFFVARRGSVVAKWIVVIFAGLSVLSLLFALAMGSFPTALFGVLAVVSLVLNVIAAIMLFRPDARAWFGERPDQPDPSL